MQEAQKRSGSFKKALEGSETFWELKKRSGRKALGGREYVCIDPRDEMRPGYLEAFIGTRVYVRKESRSQPNLGSMFSCVYVCAHAGFRIAMTMQAGCRSACVSARLRKSFTGFRAIHSRSAPGRSKMTLDEERRLLAVAREHIVICLIRKSVAILLQAFGLCEIRLAIILSDFFIALFC